MLMGVEVAALLWEYEVEAAGEVRLDVKVSSPITGRRRCGGHRRRARGRGHRAAAGAQLQGSLEQARLKLVKVVEKALA